MAKTKRLGRGKYELMESGRGGSVYYIKSKDSYEVHDKTDDTVKRSYYKNINQANHVAEKLNQIRQTYGKQMPRLTPSERRAIELYRNHRKKSDIMGVNIPDIDRLIVDALENSSLINDSPLFSDVAEQYALNQLRKGVTPEHSVTTKNRIIKINESFSDVMIGSLSTRDIQSFLDSLEGRDGIAKAETVNQYRGIFNSIFRFAKSRRMIDHNPAEPIHKIKIKRGRPEIIQPSDLSKIMNHFIEHEPTLIPALVMKAFCGVRNSELGKIKFAHIHQGEKNELTIDGTIAKNEHTRFTPIHENAILWLNKVKDAISVNSDDYVLPNKNSLRRILIGAKSLGVCLPQNAFRHSCASYMCALHEDYPRVASWLGHDVSVLMKNYRNAVSKKEGEAWFDVRPDDL